MDISFPGIFLPLALPELKMGRIRQEVTLEAAIR